MIHLKKFLEEKTDKKIHIEVSKDRRNLVQIITKQDEKIVKIHQNLVNAPHPIIRAIADFIAGKEKRKNKKTIVEYARKNPQIFSKQRKMNIDVTGKFYNLKQVFDKINEQFFNGFLSSVNISFGKRYYSKRHRSIVFGNYCPETNLIRINRSLDSDSVPEFFLEYIVFHEMLHAYLYLLDSGSTGHTKKFKMMEKELPNLEKAEKWKRENLSLFIGSKKEKHV